MKNFTEIYDDVEHDPIPKGFRVDDLIMGLRINGAEMGSGNYAPNIREQLQTSFVNLRSFIEAAGVTTDNIGQVSFFLRNIEERGLINEPWTEMFPDQDNRPTYKFMPADLAGDELVRLEAYAVMGATRRAIHVDGVAHVNPIPMAVRIGKYLFSSRMLPYDPATAMPAETLEAQADFVFQHAFTVLRAAEMTWSHVLQGRAFYADQRGQELIKGRWQSQFRDAIAVPPLHNVQYNAGDLLVMLEFIAMDQ